jgi:hypothetical protein
MKSIHTALFVSAFGLAAIVGACNLPEAEPAALGETTSLLITQPAEMQRFGWTTSTIVATSPLLNATSYRTSDSNFILYRGGAMRGIGDEFKARNASLFRSLDEHDAAAKAYFLKVGLSPSELGSLNHYTGRYGGRSLVDPRITEDVVTGYSTTFQRVVDGFSLPESVASVQLGANGAPMMLSVNWPTVPPTIIAKAKSMRDVLSSGKFVSADKDFVENSAAAAVVIHHHTFDEPSDRWEANVRVLSGKRQSSIDFDAAGNRAPFHKHVGAPDVK